MRRLICRWRGHRWDPSFDMCARCKTTAEEIYRGRDKPPPRTWAEIDELCHKHWVKGVDYGEAIGAMRVRRAYRLGLKRGCRDAFMQLRVSAGMCVWPSRDEPLPRSSRSYHFGDEPRSFTITTKD